MGFISSAFGGKEASKAARAAAAGFTKSIDTYRDAGEQARTDMMPFYGLGTNAAGTLNETFFGANGPDYSQFENSPGYQFAFNEGNRAVENSGAAKGMTQSGAQMKALTKYGQGMASQGFGDWFNRMQSMSNSGQNAANTMGQYGMRTADNVGAAQQGVGQARASGYMAKANMKNSLANTALSLGTNALMGGMGGGGGYSETSTGAMAPDSWARY